MLPLYKIYSYLVVVAHWHYKCTAHWVTSTEDLFFFGTTNVWLILAHWVTSTEDFFLGFLRLWQVPYEEESPVIRESCVQAPRCREEKVAV
jgi:hypothetical protein